VITDKYTLPSGGTLRCEYDTDVQVGIFTFKLNPEEDGVLYHVLGALVAEAGGVPQDPGPDGVVRWYNLPSGGTVHNSVDGAVFYLLPEDVPIAGVLGSLLERFGGVEDEDSDGYGQ
jgi:hypothetical protein